MTLRLNGSTSGYTEIDAPAVAGSNTLVLPTGNGSSGQFLQTNGSGNLSWAGGGKILQVVNVNTTTATSSTSSIPFDNTKPQSTEGTELFTTSITPTSSSNKLLINVVLQIGHGGAEWVIAALFQDSGANALATASIYLSTGTAVSTLHFQHYMTAPSTSSTTFKVRFGPNGGTAYVNSQGGNAKFDGTWLSSMTIMEIAA
jgi:hypothetical protein